MSCRFSTLDAAYVLGSLAPAERADFERHLSGCDECARSVRELAGLPGLLARVPAEVLAPDLDREPVPGTLLPALVAAAERQQRRRTIRAALLAAAAVTVIAGGSAVVAGSLGDDDETVTSPPPVVETTAPPQLMTPVGHSQSEGWISLTPLASGGTRLDLTCVYRSSYGGDQAHTYTVVVYPGDGGRAEQVREFSATSGEEVEESGTTSFDVDEIEKVAVEGSYGPILLLNLPRTQ
ncbi:anti-sigma factor family protein [Nocardioides bizhenqiangii]|uniref:Zf-HC2 domain-containing protein n=1 Tax=Nocardioides bizhenqiangii TaxID=3095076 RepID=A0ABZ0ZTF2_9ACTN|nr:zf-HC2 domain-containing protein [Nocardioides sp. HM61]WQQ26783.1 zf-HC2 domain-containing protein [Nocardioides sp. HM61]